MDGESTARHVDANPRAAGTPGAWTWAALMRRVLDLDVLACPRCGRRLRVLATVQDPRAVNQIWIRTMAETCWKLTESLPVIV